MFEEINKFNNIKRILQIKKETQVTLNKIETKLDEFKTSSDEGINKINTYELIDEFEKNTTVVKNDDSAYIDIKSRVPSGLFLDKPSPLSEIAVISINKIVKK